MTIGIFLYYLLWPLLWLYSPITIRVRVIVRHKNEILLVKNWFGSGHWQLPGGGIKLGEKPLHAAKREINEELGLVLNNIELVKDYAIVFKQFGLLKRNFFAVAELNSKPSVKLSKEIYLCEWKDINEYKFPKQIAESI